MLHQFDMSLSRVVPASDRVTPNASVRLAQAVLGVALTFVLATYALRGWFARYTADDYCTAGIERTAGLFGAQLYWYQSWSGRFSYYIVSGLVELAGPGVVQVLPLIALIAFVAAGAWAVQPVAVAQRWPAPRTSSWLLGGAVLVTCLQGAPNLEQALYWQTGMLTYLLPLVLMTLYAGWVVRRVGSKRRPSRRDMLVNAMVLFASAGFSETSLSVQLALLGIGTVTTVVAMHSGVRQTLLTLLGTGLLVTILAGVVVVAAPGNYVHQLRLTGSVHGLSELPAAAKASVDFVGLFTRAVEFRARLAVVVLLGLSIWLGFHAVSAAGPTSTMPRWWLPRAMRLAVIVVSAWIVLLAATVPGYFAQQWDPPERAQFDAVWVDVVALVLASYEVAVLTGQLLQRAAVGFVDRVVASRVWPLCLLVLAGACLGMVPNQLAAVPADVDYAAEWDGLDATIRALAISGAPVVVQRTLPTRYGFDFITTDPGAYPNPCVAQFYGVPSIRVAE